MRRLARKKRVEVKFAAMRSAARRCASFDSPARRNRTRCRRSALAFDAPLASVRTAFLLCARALRGARFGAAFVFFFLGVTRRFVLERFALARAAGFPLLRRLATAEC